YSATEAAFWSDPMSSLADDTNVPIAAPLCFAGILRVAATNVRDILSKIYDAICWEADKIDPEQNKAIVRSYLEEIVNQRNLTALDRYFSEDVVFNDVRNFATHYPSFLLAIQSAFPDHYLTIGDQIADGDKVVTRVTFHGTHKGAFNGIPATGKRLQWAGIAIDRIANGKVVEMWHVQNPPGTVIVISNGGLAGRKPLDGVSRAAAF
ncbi:MAG: ester cyclase, partial [Rhizomicrobium sp.]